MTGDVQKRTSGETILTEALCRALIIKKGVSPDRFQDAGATAIAVACPRHCHACCSEEVVLDLTAVESLVIYLLNRDVVHLIDEYTARHPPSGFCRFMIMDRCIINAYKPSACQMYMPVAYNGRDICFYLADRATREQRTNWKATGDHSNSYAVHGCMLMIQRDVGPYLSESCFRNIYDGTTYWREHFDDLPEQTRFCLNAIVNEDAAGLQRIAEFQFEESLAAGADVYNEAIAQHELGLRH